MGSKLKLYGHISPLNTKKYLLTYETSGDCWDITITVNLVPGGVKRKQQILVGLFLEFLKSLIDYSQTLSKLKCEHVTESILEWMDGYFDGSQMTSIVIESRNNDFYKNLINYLL